jgi:8-oxo-dGTP diphosphatase
MEEPPEGRFMVAVGAVIEHRATGRILLMQRATTGFMGGVWEVLTGRMKQGEAPEAALRREVREETGLEITIIKPLTVFHLYRGDPTPANELVGIVYWCRSASDRVVLSAEHSAHRWLPARQALDWVEDPGIKSDIAAFLAEQARGEPPGPA